MLQKAFFLLFCFILFFFPYLTSANSTADNIEIGAIDFDFKKTSTLSEASLLDILILSKKSKFVRSDLEQDIQRLKKFYFDNGFFDVLIDTAVVYDTENKVADIIFSIIENKRYTINKISYNGISHLEDKITNQIYSDNLILQGVPYVKANISSETKRILDILQNTGYFKAQIDSVNGTVISKYSERFSTLGNKVNVELNFIGTHNRYYFGETRIKIQDNKYGLENKYVTRLLLYSEGELFSQQKLIESERNVTKLAIVQSSRIQIDTIDEESNKINFVIYITLNQKYIISPNVLALDIDNQFFAGAGVGYTDRYLLKSGTVFGLSIEGLFHSKDVNRAEIKSSLFQPYLFQNNISANYNVTFGFYNFDKTLQITSLTNLLRLNYFIASFTFYNNAYLDLTVDLIRIRIKEQLANGEPSKTISSVSNFMNSIIGLTLVHDNTNSIFNPSKGFYHSVTIEEAGMLPKLVNVFSPNTYYSQYIKYYLPNRFYFDMSENRAVRIFSMQIKIGDIIEFGKGDNIIPVSRIYKFFSGGSGSLRGWNPKECGILDNPEDGGNFLFEGSLEFRWKSFFRLSNFLKNFWSVYFIDFGNVWESNKYFRFDQVALSAGIGIRYDTFIGPLRFDIGFRLYDPLADDVTGKWIFKNPSDVFNKRKFAIQFGLGQAF